MNCKLGDLAVIVKSTAGNEGRIVRCLELLPDHIFVFADGSIFSSPAWITDTVLRGVSGDYHKYVPDEWLRPIRDPGEDAQDETLSWLPVPSIEKETA